MTWLRRLVALGAAIAAYSFVEARSYRLTRLVVPVRSPIGHLTVLHLSDTHLWGRNAALVRFLERLPELVGTPDLVIATGDFLEGNEGIGPAVAGLAGLEARLGRYYVLGSHDYFQSERPGFARYLTGNRRAPTSKPAATDELRKGLEAKGWVSVMNDLVRVESPFGPIQISGVDDPYIHRHTTQHIRRREDAVLALGLTHAPDVVSEWILENFDVVLAGPTHGGQICITAVGALVTNCSLPTGLAKGLHRVGPGWLHVSPGLGTSHFSPVRFACPPEATLLDLVGESPS